MIFKVIKGSQFNEKEIHNREKILKTKVEINKINNIQSLLSKNIDKIQISFNYFVWDVFRC